MKPNCLQLFLWLLLFAISAGFAQDPHQAPETVIAAENFYHALETGNLEKAAIELHDSVTIGEIFKGKEQVLNYILTEFGNQKGAIKFSGVEYMPIDNNQILVTGFYHPDRNAKIVRFEHLWSLKNRKFIRFEVRLIASQLAEIEKK